MPTTPVRQSRFDGGEITPELYGRTDHPRYATSAKRLINFLASPRGAAKNRPGTRWMASTKSNGVAVLRRFKVGSQSYLLEFGNLYVRFYQGGAQVLNGGPPLEVVTPFTTAMLPYLKFSQKDSVLTIDYGGEEPGGATSLAPQELRRISHLSWTLSAARTAPPSGDITWGFGPIFVQPYNAGTTYSIGDRVVSGGSSWFSIQSPNTGNLPAAGSTFWINAVDANHAGGKWAYVATLIYTAVDDGVTYESPPSPEFALNDVVTPDRQIKILAANGWQAVASANVGQVIAGTALIYRGAPGGPKGLVASAVYNTPGPPFTLTFINDIIDLGGTPDYSQQPPASTSPFLTAGNPACVANFQQRRIHARLVNRPQRLVGSKNGQPFNFDGTLIVQDDDAIGFDVASDDYDEIRSLVQMRQLLAFTQSGVYAIAGFQGEPLSPTSVDIRQHGARPGGASWVTPAVAGDAVLYVQDKGSSVRELFYDATFDAYRDSDVSWFATHLFDGYTVVACAYQGYPNFTWWGVRSDGLLLGFTYFRTGDGVVMGWHQHPVDGAVEWVEVTPEGTEDFVNVVVRRTVNGATVRYVERMASRILPLNGAVKDVRFAVFLDASIQADGRNTGGTTMTFQSDAATYAGGEEGTITASAASFVTGVSSTDIGDQVVLDVNGGAYRLTILSVTDTTHARATLDQALPVAFQNAGTTSWGFARDSFSGLSHLEGKAVMVLGDANPQGPFTVAGGAISGLSPAVVAQIGLAYTMLVEPLDLAGGADAKGRQKTVKAVAFELSDSRGAWVGEDENSLYEWDDERTVADGFGTLPLFTGRAKVRMTGGVDTRGRAVLVQKDPLPCTVVALTREVNVGGDL